LDDTGRIDKIESIREGGIGVVYGIAHLIQSHGKPEVQIQKTGFGGFRAVCFSSGLIEYDVLFQVLRYLPAITRVGLLDVYAEKLNLVPVFFIDLVQATCLKTKGRSGIGTKDQGNRFALEV